jgi:uncharacterized protein YkwD
MRSVVGPCRRAAASFLAAFLLGALALAAPAGAADCQFADAQADSATTQQLAEATVCLLNDQRAAAGLGSLTATGPLGTTAQHYAEYMVSDAHFAHRDESGHNVVSRVLSTDPTLADRWLVLGENLGWGTYGMATPRSMVQGWMNSPTHRDNILYRDFDEIGVGITPGAPLPDRENALTYATVFGKLAPPARAASRPRATRRARCPARHRRSASAGRRDIPARSRRPAGARARACPRRTRTPRRSSCRCRPRPRPAP